MITTNTTITWTKKKKVISIATWTNWWKTFDGRHSISDVQIRRFSISFQFPFDKKRVESLKSSILYDRRFGSKLSSIVLNLNWTDHTKSKLSAIQMHSPNVCFLVICFVLAVVVCYAVIFLSACSWETHRKTLFTQTEIACQSCEQHSVAKFQTKIVTIAA